MFNRSKKLQRCHSIADLRKLAKKRLPRMAFDYMDGGSDDEVTLYRNSAGFGAWELLPRTLVDVSEIDTRTRVMGQAVDWPVILAPTGLNRLFHHRGELDVAPVAAESGTIYSLSSMSSYDIETVGRATTGPKWFQIYVWKDRSLVREFIQRCRDSGYHALCLTVDLAAFGKRERDLHNGMTMPPKLTFSTMADIAMHPYWWWHVLTTPSMTLANVVGKSGEQNDATSLTAYFHEQMDSSVTWEDMTWMIEEWGGPFAIKGVTCAEDAVKAVETGATGIIVSNHGGRQLDHSPAPIDVLPEIVAAVEGRADVMLDGGVRRGTDVVKALALGASACMIGRPYLYGLGSGGRAGVDRALTILRDEFLLAMKLVGCRSVGELTPDYLRYRGNT
ncbi:MAG: alpha-hydroxy acid oxidase [Gammaproteobacteria bacterium]